MRGVDFKDRAGVLNEPHEKTTTSSICKVAFTKHVEVADVLTAHQRDKDKRSPTTETCLNFEINK